LRRRSLTRGVTLGLLVSLLSIHLPAQETPPATPAPAFDTAKEAAALQNYFSSLPDLEFDYNYGDGDQLSHGHFAYSQGRYLIHVTGNQPDLESMFVFDGHRYSGLVQNARTILLSSNPQNCSLYFPDWFGSNPLFHPVAIFFWDHGADFNLADLRQPATWSLVLKDVAAPAPADGPGCLFSLKSQYADYQVFQLLGQTGLPSVVHRSGTAGPPVIETITKSLTLTTKTGAFVLPTEISMQATDPSGKLIGRLSAVWKIDEASVKLLDQPLPDSYFTIPVTTQVMVRDSDLGTMIKAAGVQP